MTDTSPADTWQLSDTEVFSKYGDAFVPRRAEQTAAVCDLLAGIPVPHVLDLCCGEGRLSEEYLRRDPEARVTVLDRSPEMLAPVSYTHRDIHAMLEPGGVFVMADLVEPAGATARTLAGDHWEEAVRRASEEQFGDDEAAVAFERTEWNHYRLPGPDPVDKPSSVAEHLDWLREAGFVEVDVVWMYAGHALFTAKRKAN